MHKVMHMLLPGAFALCVASAATVEDVAARLETGLQKEVEVLATVQSAATAAAAVQPLQAVMQELAALNGLVNDNELWNHIDSTEGMTARLIHLIQSLSKQFSRLEQAKFYGCAELETLLAPQLNPDAAKRSAP